MSNKNTNRILRSRQYRNTYEDICSSLIYGESVIKLTGVKNTCKSVITRLVCGRMEELNHRAILIDKQPQNPGDLQEEIIQQIQSEATGSFQKIFGHYLQTLADSRHFY